MMYFGLLAFIMLVLAFVCWAKTSFCCSASSFKEGTELWLFGAVVFSSFFSFYAIIMGITGVVSSLQALASKIAALI